MDGSSYIHLSNGAVFCYQALLKKRKVRVYAQEAVDLSRLRYRLRYAIPFSYVYVITYSSITVLYDIN